MIKHFDSTEITHLRNLADAIAIKPEDSDNFIDILLNVVVPSSKSDPAFIKYLNKLKNDLVEKKLSYPGNDLNSIRQVADSYATSTDTAIRRMGETLLWGLTHKRSASRQKGRK
jgi:hypothetical protein